MHEKVSSFLNGQEEWDNIQKSLEKSELGTTCLQHGFILGSHSSSHAGRQYWEMGSELNSTSSIQAVYLSPAGKKSNL